MKNSKEQKIQDFLNKEFNKELCGYFDEVTEKAESSIVKNTCEGSFEIKESPKGYEKRYSLEITVKEENNCHELRWQLLRNRSRIESNLLTAIRKLMAESGWDTSVIGNVIVKIQSEMADGGNA